MPEYPQKVEMPIILHNAEAARQFKLAYPAWQSVRADILSKLWKQFKAEYNRINGITVLQVNS